MDNLEIGRIGKAHGLRGEVTAVITSDRPERTAPGAVWILASGPRTVAAIRPFQQKWIAKLEGIDTREAAEDLTGSVIEGEPIEDDDALWAHELLGATVVTPDGVEWGSVTGVYPNPANDLIELADGTLIPTVFVTDGSGLPDRVVVDPPEGLLGATATADDDA
ncbi:ribosome maturation factor RimM [Aquihabitans sp. McL0605]|uniref:ribosome maturation factor RimM n=1 Tax=Aquihabitans sp. McL0605 TaxID=3415671 RepID=UPI003CEB2B00